MVFFSFISIFVSDYGVFTSLNYVSGATAKACFQHGRHYLGFEEDKQIFDALLKPLIKVTTTQHEEEPVNVLKDTQKGGDDDGDGPIAPPPKRKRMAM